MRPEREAEYKLGKYLTEGENIVVATHRHWMAVAEPILTATFSLLLIAFALIAGAPTGLIEALLLAWLIVFVRAIIRVCEWNLEWFVATDHRLLLIYGFIIRKVDMLPMTKVTDMTFRRSIVGRVFGYGKFVLESAGQDQALSDLHYIPDPNETYLKIVATIFKTGPDEEDVSPAEFDEFHRLQQLQEEGAAGEDDASWEEDWDDEWDEDPTARPSLRADLARLGRSTRGHDRRHGRDREQEKDPDTRSFSMGAVTKSNPVSDHTRGKKRGKKNGDYSETLYSSLDSQVDPWDEHDHGPHRKRGRWWNT